MESEKIRKKCKYPNCRKMVTNFLNQESHKYCCEQHESCINMYEKPTECPICVEDFIEEIPVFPCCHWVCKNCVIQSGKQECPVCRKLVFLNKTEEKEINKVIKKNKKEKEEQQIQEDRQLAHQISQQLTQEQQYVRVVPRIVRRNTVEYFNPREIRVHIDNLEDFLQIIRALDRDEQIMYIRELGLDPNVIN